MASLRSLDNTLFIADIMETLAVPILNDKSSKRDWIEPDDVPRPIVAYGVEANTFGDFELAPHRHAKGQILLVQRGALLVQVDGGLWIVPPRSAIWIPGDALHAIKVAGAFEGYGAFIAQDFGLQLPIKCCAVVVTPLLRELMIRSAGLPFLYEEGGSIDRMLAVLLDELAMARIEDLHLPMPSDWRLRRILDLMMASPTYRRTLDGWAKEVGLSSRTLERRMSRETGMSFGRWRQQFAVITAVKWMSEGASIQQVASDLGYDSVPSFVTMFRKTLGASPGRYMAERHRGRS